MGKERAHLVALSSVHISVILDMAQSRAQQGSPCLLELRGRLQAHSLCPQAPPSTASCLLRGSGVQAHPSSLGPGPSHGRCSLRAPHAWDWGPAVKEGSRDSPLPILWLLLPGHQCFGG